MVQTQVSVGIKTGIWASGHSGNAVKLRRNLPLLLERVGVRRIKIRKILYLLPSSQPSPGGRRRQSFLT
jgi:hypothetical protein